MYVDQPPCGQIFLYVRKGAIQPGGRHWQPEHFMYPDQRPVQKGDTLTCMHCGGDVQEAIRSKISAILEIGTSRSST